MDLKLFDTKSLSTQGVTYALRNPHDGKATDIEFILLGPDSAVYREAERRALRKRNQRLQQEDDDLLVLTDEERLETVAPCVIGWRNLQENGVDVPFSPENCRRVLQDYPVILRQLDAHISDGRNFLAKIEGNWSPSANGASA